ncbi:MAG: protease modulator HflC [Sphingobacteriia bacterium]|nr:protease modulator HflC [Sphingobacteriia bacterium]
MNNYMMKIFAVVLGLFIIINSLFIVDERKQALIFQFGEVVRTEREAGLHIKVPFIQRVAYSDKMILDVAAAEREVLAKDQKRIIVNAYAKYKIIDPLKYYQSVRNISEARTRLISDLESSMRQVIGEVPLSALLTNERALMMKRISSIVNEKALKAGIKIVDVRISRADLPKENSNAIYSRMQADREKEAKEFRAQGFEDAQRIKSEADKESREILAEAKMTAEITRGEGDKEANKIIASIVESDPEFYGFYRTLQAYKTALNKNNTKLVITPESEFFKYIVNEVR